MNESLLIDQPVTPWPTNVKCEAVRILSCGSAAHDFVHPTLAIHGMGGGKVFSENVRRERILPLAVRSLP